MKAGYGPPTFPSVNLLANSLGSILGVLRVAFFALASVCAALCLVDWAVRTRRLSPFGRVARLARQYIDPFLVPIERRIVRAGGAPSTAPWWALVAVVVSGILVITIFQFVARELLAAMAAAQEGSSGIVRVGVSWIFSVFYLALLVRVVSSWVSISPFSKWIRWSFSLTEPLLGPLRRVIPPLGMVDITPFIAYLALSLLQRFLRI